MFVIVVTVEDVQSDVNSLNTIFEVLWKNSLLNAHVLIQDQPQFWTLYTFLPYQKDCFHLEAIKIESFTPLNYTKNMNIPEDQLSPEKLTDFNQCPLKAATAYLNPFVTSPENPDPNIKYEGIDIDIVEQIAKSLNFIAIFTSSSGKTDRGIIYPNKTMTGNLKLVRISYI